MKLYMETMEEAKREAKRINVLLHADGVQSHVRGNIYGTIKIVWHAGDDQQRAYISLGRMGYTLSEGVHLCRFTR